DIVPVRKKRNYKKMQKLLDKAKPNVRKRTISKEQKQRPISTLKTQDNFPFKYYLTLVQSKITANWDVDNKYGTSKRVVVLFKISKKGELLESKIEESSRDDYYDEAALAAVKKSAPFPPLPQQYDEDTLNIHFGFSVVE
ncbi:energy transducer TonB, partial [bacterium]